MLGRGGSVSLFPGAPQGQAGKGNPLQRSLVLSRRGRGSHVGPETEEREEQRERLGGRRISAPGKKAQGHILGKAGRAEKSENR